MRFLQILLLPFSFCYGMIMLLRNLLFDFGILRSEKFPLPVISVGNLSFGGTGKTPHIEYLIRLLNDSVLTATLSRGYGRESKGFILGSRRSNVKYIGDEPMQFIKKFQNIKVAVDEKRVRGIHKLTEKFPDLGLILLDDAFQHRRVRPGISILLTDYHHLYTEDHVVPSGRLREFRAGAKRADIIVVTKTPKVFSPITRRRILEDLKPKPFQQVFFSYITYGTPLPMNEDENMAILQKLSYILLFTGIANDYPLQEEVKRKCTELSLIKFPDHHPYKMKDLELIKTRFDDLPSRKKIILTTEKDMMRLKIPEFGNFLKNLPLFYLPIEINFHDKDKQIFDKLITDYVGQTQRNR
ncbi:MAG: tetraacyldisaccharide 4'-kinase [Bacteroidetes bacterium]|nr:tetraacyldisaccharide 4'-kinase [Bacteroidota bacterium]